jgi:hypothetical protein
MGADVCWVNGRRGSADRRRLWGWSTIPLIAGRDQRWTCSAAGSQTPLPDPNGAAYSIQSMGRIDSISTRVRADQSVSGSVS